MKKALTEIEIKEAVEIGTKRKHWKYANKLNICCFSSCELDEYRINQQSM
jgi:hypothetical protein